MCIRDSVRSVETTVRELNMLWLLRGVRRLSSSLVPWGQQWPHSERRRNRTPHPTSPSSWVSNITTSYVVGASIRQGAGSVFFAQSSARGVSETYLPGGLGVGGVSGG